MTANTSFNDHTPLDRMGVNLARMLNPAADHLPHDVSERLRVARQRALEQRKSEIASHNPVHQLGTSLALSPTPSEGLGLWSILGSALPMIALLIGLVVVQSFDREQTISDLAEIDAALLVDDLPPAAYSDPGFMQYLRLEHGPSRPE